ncbi:MAG: chlorite dismutase family protein [Sulfolobaceae archaeon]|nr:chlorite dismutase family protein [Sulfolobaceae archaeon]
MEENIAYMYISTIKLSQSWWNLSIEEKRKILTSLEEAEGEIRKDAISLKRYISLRSDYDIIYWLSSFDTTIIPELRYAILSSFREHGNENYSMLSIYKPSPYVQSKNFDIKAFLSTEPLRYFIAYPMKKSVDWYLLPYNERKQIMDEHIKMAMTHPKNRGIRSYTTYSFGIGDYEFVVIYEAPSLSDWVDVVEALREAKARKWITKEEPILVGENEGLEVLLK